MRFIILVSPLIFYLLYHRFFYLSIPFFKFLLIFFQKYIIISLVNVFTERIFYMNRFSLQIPPEYDGKDIKFIIQNHFKLSKKINSKKLSLRGRSPWQSASPKPYGFWMYYKQNGNILENGLPRRATPSSQ